MLRVISIGLLLFTGMYGLIAQSGGKPQAPNVWAVSVGIGSYKNPSILTPLDGPVSQAYEFCLFVETTQFTDNTKVPILTNGKATKQAIIRTLERTFTDRRKVGPNDLIIFYYSGHGMALGKAIGICPYDYYDQQELISDEEIISIMKRSPARHKVCIIEACKTEVETMAPLSNSDKSRFNERRNKIEGGLVYLTSTEAGSPSYELPEFEGGGVFSHYFLQGINGDADADDNRIITSRELYDYLKRSVSFKMNNKQIPQINEEGYELNIPIFVLANLESQIREPSETPIVRPARTDQPSGFVLIEGGKFQMGDVFNEGRNDEFPVHWVSVSKFYLATHELTIEEYHMFCDATNRSKPIDLGRDDRSYPVTDVSWYDAIEYCNWRSQIEGYRPYYDIDKYNADIFNINTGNNDPKWIIRPIMASNGYRLPTEAEWEYAAREGGKKVRFGNGRDIADMFEMNFDASSPNGDYAHSRSGSSREQTVPIGSFDPNLLNLYDMSGNVWEWCWDWHGEDIYSRSASSNPEGAKGGAYRVVRGGSWSYHPYDCRASCRGKDIPTMHNLNIGFRLARQYHP